MTINVSIAKYFCESKVKNVWTTTFVLHRLERNGCKLSIWRFDTHMRTKVDMPNMYYLEQMIRQLCSSMSGARMHRPLCVVYLSDQYTW